MRQLLGVLVVFGVPSVVRAGGGHSGRGDQAGGVLGPVPRWLLVLL